MNRLCVLVTHLRLKNSRFYIWMCRVRGGWGGVWVCVCVCVRMKHIEVLLMVSSREVDNKVLRMSI